MIKILDSLGARLTGRDDLSDQYRRYRETIAWIVRGLFRLDARKTLLAILSNVFGGIFRAGALAFLLHYANLMEQSATISLLGYSWESRSEPVFYVSISLALIFLVFGALFVYWGNHITIQLTLDFASNCSRRMLASCGGRPQGNRSTLTGAYPVEVKRNITSIPMFSRAVRPIIQLSNPLTIFLYSLAILFYLDAQLTLVVILLALPSLLLQYMVNFHSTQNEKEFRSSRSRARRKQDELLEKYAMVPKIFPSRHERLIREYQESSIGENLRCYYRRKMARPRSALVSDALMAVMSFLVVGYLGGSALSEKIGWASFLGYLLFARISLMALRGVLVSITGFARHYSRARQMFEFFRFQKVMESGDSASLMVKAQGKDRIGDTRKLDIEPGTPALVLSNVPLSRYNLYAFIDVVARGKLDERNKLCAVTQCISNGLDSPPGGTLNELLGMPASAGDDALLEELGRRGCDDGIVQLDQDAPDQDGAWECFPEKLRACLLLQQSFQELSPLTFVDGTVLEAAGDKFSKQWFEDRKASSVIIVSDNISQLAQHGGTHIVLMAPDRKVSIASTGWCETHGAEIEAWFDSHRGTEEAELDDDLDDDD